ncbi:zinc finger E-box-binding homeobox 1 isoform X1 [Hemicordylus capensis]|uniref:zinc finger E-box-binding homeobox 1 isoform X1 n=2 Tax=Hemicordylus capensis TaxID=884348 RepID=UPI00230268B1|nr:zinc finger E-box-binding homeobox 1 isoform X1 [Hemicordylus capensis]
MADGPRCKRRKQANPRRNNVTNYNNVVETNSDSDDEDKLHIVEEESITDAGDCDNSVPDDDLPKDHTVLPESNEREGSANSCWEDEASKEAKEILGPEAQTDESGCTVKEDECDSDAENEQNHDPNVEEFLQQEDTAVIYPEAPEEDQRQGTPEASGQDENGTPDAFSQLLTCPYCDRGYKRFTSLKEHIKYRHEKNEDNFSCSLCSYTFAYRTQLERHMTSHKSGRDQRHVTQSSGNRKFKCTECGKAFKYKHHLKEHLRIHSGEKPYECPNCKKRFSHSGSYSSHISSKKCIGLVPVNGRARSGLKTSQCSSPSLSASPGSPARPQIRQKVENKPLQEQLPINQIKTEPVDYEFKPIVVASGINCSAPLQNGVFSGGSPLQATSSPQGVVQAVVLPTVGLVSPISINLSDIQNVLKVAVDGNVIRQVLENSHTNLTSKDQETINTASIQQAGHSLISAISLPLVDQDGTTKIIINYSLEQPSQLQVVPQNLKKETPAPTNSCKIEKLPEDLRVKSEKEKSFEGETNDSTCLLCDDCPGDPNALQESKHYDMKNPTQPPQLSGVEAEKSESSVSSEAGEANLTPGQPPLKNLLSLLKAYYALNAQPSSEELSKIADSVNLPLEVVKKWFEKMQAGQISVPSSVPSSPEPDKSKGSVDNDDHAGCTPVNEHQDSISNSESPLKADKPQTVSTGSTQNGSRSNTPSPSPLNLSSSRNSQGYVYLNEGAQEEPQIEPLDLSLPKQHGESLERSTITSVYQNSVYSVQEEPLNLTCAKKEPQKDNSITDSETVVNVIPPSANPINIAIPTVTAQLPTIVAIADQNSVPCLRALAANKQTILIPQVAYTYSTTVNPTIQETPKPMQANGSQDERQDTSSEGVSNVEDQNDSDSTPPKKKMRKTENGMYACDLCDKIFQKSSSLLRHKYEHTGKRPHECGICKKAFKHKHHLIEHMRLHSGEKPYQCDKCGKRFSHSGSYSQHMNHRYSYCKREAEERDSTEQEETAQERLSNEHAGAGASPSQLDSDERDSLTREEEEDSEKEEEEDEDKEMDEPQEEKEGGKLQEEEEEEEVEEEKTEGSMKDDGAVNEESSEQVIQKEEQVSEEETKKA